jgi:hypothetical protein
MANLTTDVTPILQQAFPNGKPEMSASDFDKAHKFVVGRKNGSIPKPTPSMDYAFWAHTMIVEWRMRVDEWEKRAGAIVPLSAATGQRLGAPVDLICPQCEVKCVLNMTAGDVLVCPGGCHRAITVNTFVQLFKRPAQNFGGIAGSGGSLNSTSGIQTRRNGPIVPVSPAPAALSQTVPKGARPEDYGIHEKPKKSRTPLVGWRMWDILPDSMPRLQSLSNAKGVAWEPMVPQIGTCNSRDPSEITDHSCPSWEHRCGVHAVKELPQVKKWGAPCVGRTSKYVRIIGEIDLWGRVLEYSEGFRAEWGYPKKMYVPDYLPNGFDIRPQELADMIWMAYLTEVEVNQSIFDTFL